MKINLNYLLMVVGVFAAALGLFLVYKTITTDAQNGDALNPSNFNIIFKYGPFARTGLDTFNNTVSNDQGDSDVSARFVLSQKDRELIRQKIKELRLNRESLTIAGTKVPFEPAGVPPDSYFLKVKDGDKTWEKSWDEWGCDGPCEEISEPYAKFFSFMVNLIESKNEFKKLPKMRGGYM